MWRNARIADDEPKVSNRRGTVAFASSGRNGRTTQLFVNLSDNPELDEQGFAPVGEVVEGMENVLAFYSGYRSQPDQTRIRVEGNAYLEKSYPKLDAIERAVLLDDR